MAIAVAGPTACAEAQCGRVFSKQGGAYEVRRVALVDSFVLVLAAGAQAADSVRVRGECAHAADSTFQAQATIDHKTFNVKLTFSASGVFPNVAVTCGYVCALGGAAHLVNCGTTDDKGKWRFQETLSNPAMCGSVAPFALVGG